MNQTVQKRTRRGPARHSAEPTRTNDPARTVADIIEVATREFAEKGLAGARIDVIAEAMRTSKRMIYYYFGSKEGLYIAVLEEAYRRIREIEREAGIGLSEVFLLYGQNGYRRIERRCLERVLDAHAEMVIAVGGGIVSEPDAYDLLLRHCFTVWVKASPDEHMARVVAQGDLRPMQGKAEAMDDLKRILDAREPLYRKADVTLDTSGDDAAQSLTKLRQAVIA